MDVFRGLAETAELLEAIRTPMASAKPTLLDVRERGRRDNEAAARARNALNADQPGGDVAGLRSACSQRWTPKGPSKMIFMR